jgi:hypothetical protein
VRFVTSPAASTARSHLFVRIGVFVVSTAGRNLDAWLTALPIPRADVPRRSTRQAGRRPAVKRGRRGRETLAEQADINYVLQGAYAAAAGESLDSAKWDANN